MKQPILLLGKGLLLLLLVFFISIKLKAEGKNLFTSSSFFQTPENITVRGTVSDAKGPLPAVTVTVRGTTTGTRTDANGDYSLSAPGNGTLVFTYVGFVSKEVAINNRTAISITLETNTKTLGDVVVVGYGTQRKVDVTGATASVSSRDLNQANNNNALDAINGKVSGLQVTNQNSDPTVSRPTIRLRGITSLSASSEPLIVLDGVAGANINDIAPDDIASVDVLKDASSAAIYGSRGAAGVIIITSKKGVAGRTTVSFDSYVGLETPGHLPQVLSGADYRAKLAQYKLGKSNDFGSSTDWFKKITRNAVIQNYHLSVSGGTDKFQYQGSLTYYNQPGPVITGGADRLNGRVSLRQLALKDKLEIQVILSQQLANKNLIQYDAFRSASKINPTYGIYDSTGAYFQPQGVFEIENPVARLQQIQNKSVEKTSLGNVKVFYEVAKGLKLGVNASNEDYSQNLNQFVPSYYHGGGNSNSSGEQYQRQISNRLVEATGQYSTIFGKSTFTALAGYTYQKLSETYMDMRGNKFLDQFGSNNLSASPSRDLTSIFNGRTEAILIGYIARINYNFDDRYLLTANIRRDGSSRFGGNNHYGTFPSASLGWRIKQESFLKDVRGISDLKLRVGYGVTGQQDGIPDYTARGLYSQSGNYYSGDSFTPAYSYSQNANPDLKWESTSTLNLGLDFGFWDNRLTGSLELYDKKTNNLLYTYPISIGSRYGSSNLIALFPNILANVGKMENKGVELALSYLAVNQTKFQWRTNLVASTNRNRITSLSSGLFSYNAANPDQIGSGALGSGQGSLSPPAVLQVGYAVGEFFGPQVTGFDAKGNYIYKDQGKGGKGLDPNGLDRTYLGDPNPKLILGWTNDFTYGNFGLNFTVRSNIGGKVADGFNLYNGDPNRFPLNNVLKSSFNGRLPYGGAFSDAWSSLWVENGTFARLDNARLSYKIPVRNSFLKSALIYVAGNNLFVITKYKGTDPEARAGSTPDPYGSVSTGANGSSTGGNQTNLPTNSPSDPRTTNLSPGIEPITFYPRERTFLFGVRFEL